MNVIFDVNAENRLLNSMIVSLRKDLKYPNFKTQNLLWKTQNSTKVSFFDSTYNRSNAWNMNKPFHRNSFFTMLPVILEEDGRLSDEFADFKNYFYIKNNYENVHGTMATCDLAENPDFYEVSDVKNKTIESFADNSYYPPRFPYELYINCMLNSKMKQSHQIWETKFAKRLLNIQNCIKDNEQKGNKAVINPSKEEVKYVDLKLEQKLAKVPCEVYKSSKRSKKKKNSGNCSHRVGCQSKKKNSIEKEDESFETVFPSKEKIIEHERKTVHFIGNTENLSFSLSNSTTSSSKRRLTACVQNILDAVSQLEICTFCGEKFDNVEDLLAHKKIHDSEKQICVICENVFMTADEYIRHLLLHESVDEFSCKKCKKYFPTFERFQEHLKLFHLKDYKLTTIYSESQKKIESQNDVNSFDLKYECQRCKKGFPCETDFRAHKKLHFNEDLTAASRLCSKFVNVI